MITMFCLALSPHSKKVWVSNLGPGLSVWSLHVRPVHVWVFYGHSGFYTRSKDMLVRCIDQTKLTVGVSEGECLSVFEC